MFFADICMLDVAYDAWIPSTAVTPREVYEIDQLHVRQHDRHWPSLALKMCLETEL